VPLNSRITISAVAELTSALDLATGRVPLQVDRGASFSSGTAANQADRIFHDTRTLAASATENLDLAGVLADSFGATITFARIKGILVAAASGNTNNVVVGGHATAAFVNWVGDATDTIVVRPGGTFCLTAPDATAYAVTATTGDMLTVTNSAGGTGVTYDIILIGASA
jgi:hypothetical protein